jgi:hypothetical protein
MNLLDKVAEEIVDAVGEALGVETGIIHENRFKAAKTAVYIALQRLLRDSHA